MDLFGEFQKAEIDGKPYLVYQNVIKPLPQIHSPISSDEKTIIKTPLPIQNQTNSDEVAIDSGDDIPPPPLFVCPNARIELTANIDNITTKTENGFLLPELFFKLKTSPLLGDNSSNGHDVLPLFWCNNKEADPGNDCSFCRAQMVGTNYYLCVHCGYRYHKECVESPLEISYPSHFKHSHSLQFYYSMKSSKPCILCTKKADLNIYYCSLCDINMHALCAQTAIPFFINQPKRHDHTLTLFPRQTSLTCNVCGLVNKHHLTYICRSICDFVAHKDCIYIPQTIRISRHYHRVSFTSSLPLGKWSCGVCRQEVDHDYGAYTCNVCSGYVVHTRCALRTDIWDGIELEGVPEEDEDVEPPFERISDGIILHFSHGDHLKIDTDGVYDENKFCEACTLPINEENFYVCVKCDFIIHETCAAAPRKKVHPLHPHQLELSIVHDNNVFECNACTRLSNGFGYRCPHKDCTFILDVACASTTEPFNYQGHQHLLFLSLDPKEKPMCHICKSKEVSKVFNCIECDFILCFMCATLPYTVRYKHDKHYLIFCRGDEASGSDWCELCEGKLSIGGKAGFYKCNYCCTTLHINCLLGPYPYLKSSCLALTMDSFECFVQRNSSLSRPICDVCYNRCLYPTLLLCTIMDNNLFILCRLVH